jgi:DNA transposition AAA+ family ATPase
MRYKIVAVKNVARLLQASQSLTNRARGMPGMGVVDGFTGVGKTQATIWMMTKVRGLFVRALSVSTPASFLESICRELDIEPKGTNAKTLDAVVRKLAEDVRPLFIDEGDKLVTSMRLIEITRDLHDLSLAPVVLIGEGNLRRKIEQIPRLAGRMLETVEFQPLDFPDTRLMTNELCEVEVSDELVQAFTAAGHGSARLSVVALQKIEKLAKAHNLKKVGLSDWPTGASFFMGDISEALKKGRR